MKALIALAIAAAAVFSSPAAEKVKVACIGNSITYGFRLPDPARDSYPSQLAGLLGEGYEVGNFGHSGATLLRKGHLPYNSLPEFRAALDFRPDIAVIHLGVNDTDPRNWPNYNSEFVGDYMAIIDSLKAVNPDVRIILAELSPLRATHHRFQTGTRDWRLKIQEAIRATALAAGAELIDFNAPLRDRQDLIFDGIHPDTEGAALLAETVRGAITGNYGGLSLPRIMQSGMVLQRERPLTFRGRADAGDHIELTLDGRTYRTLTDNRGDWQITTAPLTAGPAYTLTVSDGATTLTLTDIQAGEVWLASGQSNMEFPLGASVGGREAAAASADSLLRIFDMKEIARTDKTAWPDSVIDAMKRLDHYRPAVWQAASPATTERLSAVAYHFARELRDSLGVAVGIICNPVGGSPAESWVDINTLEASMPGILVNPRSNDYLQKWVQQRIGENLGSRTDGRHPYEPSYLFAAGIRPLASFPLAGVIWYQGESNAHNTELHEHLFPLLVDSWRREFRYPEMPFLFVQLSSINRPSWPEFRNSQRLLAERVPHTAMAVSHDLGDSLDVHPRNKRPIGHRLARLALSEVYGADIEAYGPTLRSATAAPGRMTLVFDHAHGLSTADSLPPLTFEMAETDGLYLPASATITSDNTIELKNMSIKKPRFVRYGWQPFTRANLVNSSGLPASTFKAEADNAADFCAEPGMERGVSAPFYGTMPDGCLIICGGANFPTDRPLAADAVKKLYRGIYAAEPETLSWERVGSLAEPIAYGASATTPEGIALIGGTTDAGPSASARLLRSDLTLTPLPDLPATVADAAAAAIGRDIYLAGGSLAGKPSNALFRLGADGKWTKLRPFPGNPRVQPAMAASGGKLYLWGGFAGKQGSRPATLETSGLVYDPATNRWSPLAPPVGSDGNELTMAGGLALTLPDGRIALTGGVNKDVFLEALQNQAPDYLMHPIEWYRFNGEVVIFNPADGSYTPALTTADAARAGAAGFSAGESDIIIYGGELKPRIRTAETIRISL